MAHDFDKDYWEQHWRRAQGDAPGAKRGNPPSPYLATELGDLTPGTALDAGCGTGAEAIWLARMGWQVTAADISIEALDRARERAASEAGLERVLWLEADLSTWEPGTQFDLVTTHYAHPAMPQLQFYDRIARWVAPGGTLLIVGHLSSTDHDHGGHDQGHGANGHSPLEASATAAAITARLNEQEWEVVTACELERTLVSGDGHELHLHDVVVRAQRRA